MNVKKAILGTMIAAAGGAVLSHAAIAEDDAKKTEEAKGKSTKPPAVCKGEKGAKDKDKKGTEGAATGKHNCEGCGKG